MNKENVYKLITEKTELIEMLSSIYVLDKEIFKHIEDEIIFNANVMIEGEM